MYGSCTERADRGVRPYKGGRVYVGADDPVRPQKNVRNTKISGEYKPKRLGHNVSM